MTTTPKTNCLLIASEKNDQSNLFRNYVGVLSETLIDSRWVYVAEEHRNTIEDSPSGVRYLGWDVSLVEHFGDLEGIVVVNDPGLARQLAQDFPDKAPVMSWHPLDRRIEVFGEPACFVDHIAKLMECEIKNGAPSGTPQSNSIRKAA